MGEEMRDLKPEFDSWKSHVGPGWHRLLDHLAAKLGETAGPDLRVTQIKEKWGYLTVYLDGEKPEDRKIVADVEEQSGLTCERCGEPGFRCSTGSCSGVQPHYWIRTLCLKHQDERHQEQLQERERLGFKAIKV